MQPPFTYIEVSRSRHGRGWYQTVRMTTDALADEATVKGLTTCPAAPLDALNPFVTEVVVDPYSYDPRRKTWRVQIRGRAD
jgi:hypothetical protein